MATEAQIAANRLNAQKSTGPKTTEGKAVASLNGLKHAALARKILVSSPAAEESAAEFQALCDEFFGAYTPVGPVEEMLVKQIVKAIWCLERAGLAESAEITLSLQAVAKENGQENPQTNRRADYASGHVRRVLQFASLSPETDITGMLVAQDEGCEYFLDILTQARKICDSDHGITRETFATLFKLFGNPFKSLTDPLTRMMEAASAHFDKPDARALLEKHQLDVIAFFEDKIRHYEEILDRRKSTVTLDALARRQAAVLPSPSTLYKILRYSSAQERQLYRSMDQLQKLQSRRKTNEKT
jgi:hypothetical protein